MGSQCWRSISERQGNNIKGAGSLEIRSLGMRGMDAQLDFVFRRFLAGRKLRKGSPGVAEEFEVGPLPAGYDLYCSVRLDLIGF